MPDNKTPKTGETWIGVVCVGCGDFIPLFHDPSGGKVKIGSDGPEPSKFKTKCPCGVGAVYPDHQLQSLKIP
jgi:hypothetical protein